MHFARDGQFALELRIVGDLFFQLRALGFREISLEVIKKLVGVHARGASIKQGTAVYKPPA
jgi:hypothetical protein